MDGAPSESGQDYRFSEAFANGGDGMIRRGSDWGDSRHDPFTKTNKANFKLERTLAVEERRTYCRIVTASKLTLDIQQKIDAFYPKAEAKTIVLPE
jgi:hypothetical protein